MSKESLARYHKALVQDSSGKFTKEQKVGIIAQSLTETGRGTSILSDKNNFGGMMWRKEFEGIPGCQRFEYTSPSDNITTDYVACRAPEDYVNVYYAFIERPFYVGWKSTKTSYAFIKHLKDGGYAADPNYVKKVSSLFPEAENIYNIYKEVIKDETFSLISDSQGLKIECSDPQYNRSVDHTIKSLQEVFDEFAETHPTSKFELSFSQEEKMVSLSDIYEAFRRIPSDFLKPLDVEISTEGATEIKMIFSLKEGYKYE